MDKSQATKEVLYNLYIIQNKSQSEIGEMFGVSRSAVGLWIKKYDIPDKSQEKIKESNISTRIKNGLSARPILSKDELYDLYVVKNFCKTKIADLYDSDYNVISRLIKKYGIKKTSSDAKESTRLYIFEKYGTDNVSKSEEIKDRIKRTNVERYGSEYATQNDYIRKKISENTPKHFGKMSDEDREKRSEKAKETCLNIYGVENPSMSDAVKEKIRSTNTKKYGVPCVLQNESVKEKCRLTNKERYGCEFASSSDYVKNKIVLANIEKYGVGNFNQKRYNCAARKVLLNKDNMTNFLTDHYGESIPDMIKILGCSYNSFCNYIKKYNLAEFVCKCGSSQEKEVFDFVKGLGVHVESGNRTVIAPQEIDIYCENEHIGIEYNGSYWHSFATLEFNGRNGKTLHREKSLNAEKRGVHLIHIYDYEWNNAHSRKIVESIISCALGKQKYTMQADSCSVREIDEKSAKLFLNENSLEKYKKSDFCYGLFHKNKLVQIMCFRKCNASPWLITSYCTILNTVVADGFRKLFDFFKINKDPKAISFYKDYNKFSWDASPDCVMSGSKFTDPDGIWVINDKPYKRCPKEYTDDMELLLSLRVFRTGSKKYLWEKSQI